MGGGGSRQALLNLVCPDGELCPRLQQRPRVALLFLERGGMVQEPCGHQALCRAVTPPRMPQLCHPGISFCHSQKPAEMVAV